MSSVFLQIRSPVNFKQYCIGMDRRSIAICPLHHVASPRKRQTVKDMRSSATEAFRTSCHVHAGVIRLEQLYYNFWDCHVLIQCSTHISHDPDNRIILLEELHGNTTYHLSPLYLRIKAACEQIHPKLHLLAKAIHVAQ